MKPPLEGVDPGGPVAVLRAIDADLRGDFGHWGPIQPPDRAAGKPLAEVGLLAPLEEQIRLIALLLHIHQRAIEPGRIQPVPQQRFSPGIEPDAPAF